MDRRKAVENSVVEHIRELYGIQEFSLDDKFLELGDTLDFIELLMYLEMEFNLKVSEDDSDKLMVKDVNNLVGYILQRLLEDMK